jgi:hypothetical protein
MTQTTGDLDGLDTMTDASIASLIDACANRYKHLRGLPGDQRIKALKNDFKRVAAIAHHILKRPKPVQPSDG